MVLAGALDISIGKPVEYGTMLGQIQVGETGLLSDRPRSATLIALRDCSLLRIGKVTAANLGSDAQTRLSRAHVDVLLEQPLDAIGIRDWRAYDQAVESGYRHVMERMAAIESTLREAVASGGTQRRTASA